MSVPISYNIRNLVVRKGTTIMTAIGIGMTVAVLVMVLALMAGLSSVFANTANPRQALVLRKGTNAELTSTVSAETYQIIRRMSGIAESADGEPMVSPEGLTVVNLPSLENPTGMNVTVRGLLPIGLSMRTFTILDGAMFKPGLRQIVVGESISKRYPDAQIHKQIKFGKGEWEVVGVFKAGESAANSEIWGDLNQLRGDFEQEGGSNSLLVRLESEREFEDFKKNVADDKRLGSAVMSETEYYAAMTESGAPLMALGFSVAVIMAIGSAFAATNTMYAAVARRSREIGTLRSLGFGRWSILFSFMFESICLALIGGILGVLVALPLNGLTSAVGSFTTFSEVAFRFRVGAPAIGFGLLFAAVIGAIGGFLPAWSAANKNIIAALRDTQSLMHEDLEQLRIPKEHRASRAAPPVWPWILLGLVLLLAAGAFVYLKSGASAIEVQTVVVRVPDAGATRDSAVLLNATGYVNAAHRIELASRVLGRVSWVGVEMGDLITKGEVLVRLEDDEYRARVAQSTGNLENAQAKLAELEAGSRPEEIAEAAADLEQQQAELANAVTNFNRLKEMDLTHTVSRQEVDDAEALMHSRQAQVDARKARLDLVKKGPRKEQIDAQRAVVRQLQGSLAQSTIDLDNTVIRSPIDATVLNRNVEVGEFVTTGFVGDRGAKGYVLSIADLKDLRIELDVSQNDIARVSDDQPCWIVTDAYPDHRYKGVVDLISPEANRSKATVQVRVKVLEPDKLMKPDMNATVSFLAIGPTSAPSSAEPARPPIRIPGSAVRDGAVFVVENGAAVRRPVTQGQSLAGGETEIRTGLIGGEELIVRPPAALKDGDAVKKKE